MTTTTSRLEKSLLAARPCQQLHTLATLKTGSLRPALKKALDERVCHITRDRLDLFFLTLRGRGSEQDLKCSAGIFLPRPGGWEVECFSLCAIVVGIARSIVRGHCSWSFMMPMLFSCVRARDSTRTVRTLWRLSRREYPHEKAPGIRLSAAVDEIPLGGDRLDWIEPNRTKLTARAATDVECTARMLKRHVCTAHYALGKQRTGRVKRARRKQEIEGCPWRRTL